MTSRGSGARATRVDRRYGAQSQPSAWARGAGGVACGMTLRVGVSTSMLELTGTTTPRFSVLVAAHNHDKYIGETLDSVAAQSYRDFELVLVDDGSTDDTAVVVDRWLKANRDISGRMLQIENGGQSAALEAAFSASTGDWMALLDSDDVWHSTKLQAVASAIAGSPRAGMIVHPLSLMNESGESLPGQRPFRARLTEGDAREAVRRTARQVAPPTSGVTIRRDVFASLLPMATRDFKQAADAYLTLGASLLTPIRAIEEPQGRYRISVDGQYLRRLVSVEGLDRTVAIQRRIVSALGIEGSYHRNAYFMRMEFARAKMSQGWSGSLPVAVQLINAVMSDSAFTLPQRVVLATFWAVCGVLPRAAFRVLWSWFIRRQAGQR